MARKFMAQYDGSCYECGDDIESGDMIGYVDDSVVCEACFDEAQPEPVFEDHDEYEPDWN